MTRLQKQPPTCAPSINRALVVVFTVVSMASVARSDDSRPSIEIEGIVVTANKRTQREAEVTASLDVVTSEELSAAHITRVEDLAASLPNVDVAEFSDGQYRLIYRGVGATGTSDNQNFNTAIDNVIVPYGRAYRLLDLERVEVLRGPQGTLYGRNTNAGVINVVTHDGRDGAPATASMSYGSGEYGSAAAAFGGRIEDTDLFYRVAARFERSDGFIENPVLGIDDSHRMRNGTARGTLGWEGDAWMAKLSLTYDEYSGNSDDLVPLSTRGVSRAPALGKSDGRMLLPVLTVARDGEAVDFASISAYATTRRDLTFSAVISPALLGQFDEYDSFSQEFRFNGNAVLAGRDLEWISGVYYLNERNPFRSTVALMPQGLLLLNQKQTRATDVGAVFGEVTYDVSDNWRITSGLRVATERQDVQYRVSASAPMRESDETYTTVQPKLVLARHWGANAQVYGSVSRGFRAGSVFVGNEPVRDAAYDPENTWQYELGYKLRSDDSRWGVDAAVFYIDWSDLQVQRSVIASTSPFTVATVVDNATGARSWGGELSIDWMPVRDLSFYLKSGYTNARYRDYQPTPTLSYSGNLIEMVPEFSASFGGGWRPAQGLGLGADITRVGRMPFDGANSSVQSAYTVVNADVSYAIGSMRFAVAGRNLFDEAYSTRGLVTGGSTYVHFADPRSVFGEISVSF